MTTATPNVFKMIVEQVKNKTLSETAYFNVAVSLYDLLKKVATDRQWVVKHLPYNPDIHELFRVFIEQELKPKVSDVAALQMLDFSCGIVSTITTHHKILREAFEHLITQHLEAYGSCEYNIESDEVLPLKKALCYLGHTLHLETHYEPLKKQLQGVQDKLAQELFFTATYLLMNSEKTKNMSRIQLEWLASQFLHEENAPTIEYIIGHWTRKVLIQSLIALSLKAPQKEPETDAEKEMAKEIIFSTKPEDKNK
jgi:hypothetical protein